MNTKKKFLTIACAIFGLALIIVSCNKNQNCINRLEGTWDLTESKIYLDDVEITGTDTIPSTSTYTFDKFKTKDQESGDLVVVTNTVYYVYDFETDSYNSIDTTYTATAKYKIQDDCHKFWWQADTDGAIATTADIITLTKSSFEFHFSETYGESTYYYEYILTKQ